MSSFECSCKACGNEIAEVQCSNCKKSNMALQIVLPEETLKRDGYIGLQCPNCDHASAKTYHQYFKKQNSSDLSGLVLNCPKCNANIYPKFSEIPFYGELRAKQDKVAGLSMLIGFSIVVAGVYFIFF